MTGIVLLSIFAIACLVHIAFVISDIRDALHEVRSMLREHLFALETVIAKLDGPFAGNEKAIHDSPDIANIAREQRDREFKALEDLLRSKTKVGPDEALPTVSRLVIAWNDVRTRLLATITHRGPANNGDGKGP